MADSNRVQCVIASKRGKRCLVVDGYRFTEFRDTKHKSIIMYRCTTRDCTAYVLVHGPSDRITGVGKGKHNHDRMSEREVAREIVKFAALRRVLADRRTLPSQIIQQELNANPRLAKVLTAVDKRLIRKSCYNARSKSPVQTNGGEGGSTEHHVTGRRANVQLEQPIRLRNEEVQPSSPLAPNSSLFPVSPTVTSSNGQIVQRESADPSVSNGGEGGSSEVVSEEPQVDGQFQQQIPIGDEEAQPPSPLVPNTTLVSVITTITSSDGEGSSTGTGQVAVQLQQQIWLYNEEDQQLSLLESDASFILAPPTFPDL